VILRVNWPLENVIRGEPIVAYRAWLAEMDVSLLGLSITAVKARLLRARLQLRERLNQYFRRDREGSNETVSPRVGNKVASAAVV